MSRYFRGCGLTWAGYLQAESLVDDIRWEISESATKVLGSLDSIAEETGARIERHQVATTSTLRAEGAAIRQEMRDGLSGLSGDVRAVDATLKAGLGQLSEDLGAVNETLVGIDDTLVGIDDTLQTGFVTLHFDLDNVRETIVDMGAKFDWGFNELALRLGHMGDTLSDLLRVARTPEQTWAYEQFDIARDACRKGLYSDAIDYAQRAVGGYQSHTGYRLDHRPHNLLGLMYLGDRKSASSGIINPEIAEKHFIDAARYAEAEYKEAAAQALTGASFAAYTQPTQGAMGRALAHAMKAVKVCGKVPEAHFQLAIVEMNTGSVDSGLEHLRSAIKLDRHYVEKAWADPNFTRHVPALSAFTDKLKNERANFLSARAKALSDTSWKIVHEARSVLTALPDSVEPVKSRCLGTIQAIEDNTAAFQPAMPMVITRGKLLDVFAIEDNVEAARNRLQTSVALAASNQELLIQRIAFLKQQIASTTFIPPTRNLPAFPRHDEDSWVSFAVLVALILTMFAAFNIYATSRDGLFVTLLAVGISSVVIFFILLVTSVVIFLIIGLFYHHSKKMEVTSAHAKAAEQDKDAEKTFNERKARSLADTCKLDKPLQKLTEFMHDLSKHPELTA